MKAFITGVNGQDGAFLSKLLLSKGYEVYGGIRRSSQPNLGNLKTLGIDEQIKYIDLELTEQASINNIIREHQFDEVYNLAAMSFVGSSFNNPVYTAMTDGVAVLYLLEAIRIFSPQTKFYQASTSEMFGMVQEVPQRETTPFYPRSPYGSAKLFAHNTVVNYRESYGLFACSGILFNHESELRGKEFVTRKISLHVANTPNKVLQLGNLEAKRDWGYAPEYVEGMWLMLQQEKPDTYILSTNETYTIKQFVEWCYKVINIDIKWQGGGVQTKGYNALTNELLVESVPEFYRPCEVDLLLGCCLKANRQLKWKAQTYGYNLAEKMVKFDIANKK